MSETDNLRKVDMTLERVRRLETELSRVIGILVERGMWPVDETTGRSAPRKAGASEAVKGRDASAPKEDPIVRQDPPRWKGKPYKGAHFSATSPEYLSVLRSFLLWCADRDDERGVRTSSGRARSEYLRGDAIRAEAWREHMLQEESSQQGELPVR